MAQNNDDVENGLESFIDANLKLVYDTLASEPLPNEFVELLNQLRNADTEIGGSR